MDIYLFWLVFGLVAVAILELILSAQWSGFYVRHGITVYSAKIPLHVFSSANEIADLLSRKPDPDWGPTQLFQAVSENEVAFREKIFEFRFHIHYTPIMHGLITINPFERTLVVKGFLDWFITFFILSLPFLYWIMPSDFGMYFGVVFCITLLMIYFIQAKTYRRIGTILEDAGRDSLGM